MAHFYISFATTDRFLGATVVEATSVEGAIDEAGRRGLNPGGEALVWEMPPGESQIEQCLNRLVSKAELLSSGSKNRHMVDETEWERAIGAASGFVCESHNE